MSNKTIKTILIIASITGISFSAEPAPENKSLNSSKPKTTEVYSFNIMPDVLPGTNILTIEGDLSSQMLDGAHRFIENKIDASIESRALFWNRDLVSKDAYEASTKNVKGNELSGVDDKTNFKHYKKPGDNISCYDGKNIPNDDP